MIMTDVPTEEDGTPRYEPDEMLTTGEVAAIVGRGMTRRKVDQLVRKEHIPYVRLGGWVQIPRWVADELIRRMDAQLDLRDQLGRLLMLDETDAVLTQRDELRGRLVGLEGPITRNGD